MDREQEKRMAGGRKGIVKDQSILHNKSEKTDGGPGRRSAPRGRRSH